MKDESNLFRRKKFSQNEDQLLILFAPHYGEKNWKLIAKHLPGRTARQCRDRYQNYLLSGLYNGPWTPQEEQTLQEQFLMYGTSWSKIAKSFPNRSQNNIKNHWNSITKKKSINQVQSSDNSRNSMNPPLPINPNEIMDQTGSNFISALFIDILAEPPKENALFTKPSHFKFTSSNKK